MPMAITIITITMVITIIITIVITIIIIVIPIIRIITDSNNRNDNILTTTSIETRSVTMIVIKIEVITIGDFS